MKGNVSLEFINFVNPDLKWKIGTKGSRSNSRRGRKSIPSIFSMDSAPTYEGTRKVDDTTVSDMDKLNGVTVLGRRFSDSIDQVPIKKRRFALPSYSQFPRSTSPSNDEQESNPNTKQRCKETEATDTLGFRQKISRASCGDTDDFSGIKILAAVACNNSVFSDVGHNDGGSAVEESTEEVVGLSATASDDFVNEDKIVASSLQDSTVTLLQNCTGSNHGGANESASTQIERVHFDLNVPWEQPSDFVSVDSGANALQNNEIQGQEKYESTNKMILSDVVGDHHASGDLKGNPDETYALNEDTETGGSGQEENRGEHSPSQRCNIQQNFTSDTVGAKDNCPSLSDESLNISLCGLETKQISNVCSLNVQLGNDICSGSIQDETCNISSTSLKQNGDEDSQKASGTCENESIHQDRIHVLGCQPVAPISLAVHPGKHPQKSDSRTCVPSGADPSVPAMPNVDGLRVEATDDVKGQYNETSDVNSAEDDSSSHSGSVGLVQKSLADSSVTTREASSVLGHADRDSLAKATLENPSDDSSESDVYQADKVHMVCTKNAVELQGGYDSQFEDGELRESDVPYCWDDNGEDCEVEHVDYGSDWDDDRLSGLGNEQEEKADRGSSPGCDNGSKKIEQTGAADAPRDDLVSMKTRTPEELTNSNKEFPSELFSSRSSNREIVSRFEGCNAVHRSDGLPRNRGDLYYNLYSRGSREAGSKNIIRRDRPTSHLRGRSPEGRRFVEPTVCWSVARRHSPPYRGSCTSGLSRLKGSVENRGYVMASDHADSEVVGFVGRENRARRPFINPSYKGAYERIDRRSPGNRESVYSTPTGMLPIRDGSPIRGRFRRFPQGTARSTREQYHGSLPEDNNEYSNRFAQRLTRRERSISPNRGRPHYALSYKRSRSRSRSRSPISYLPPRERHEGSRFRSRSPDFRPGSRMDRGRAPFQKRFPAEFDDEFVSQGRRRFEPQRPSRCFDDRNGTCDDFRGRKSPSAIVQQSQRFSSARSSHNRSDSDDHRPYLPSRKFIDTGGSGGGGVYEGSEDDRRAQGNRFESVHRVRRYDTDGVMRRFMASNSHNDSYRVVNRGPREIVSYSEYWR